MRYLLVTLDFLPDHGGVARYYDALATSFPAHQLSVLAPSKTGAEKIDASKSYAILRKKFLTRFFWPHWIPLVWNIFRLRSRYDFFLAGQVLPVGTVLYFLHNAFGVPYGVMTHGMDIALPGSHGRKASLRTKVLRNATFVVANSENTKKTLLALGIHSECIVVLLPGTTLTDTNVPTEKIKNFRQTLHIGEGSVLLTVARLVERKGIDIVLQALPTVLKRFPDLHYCVVGDGPDRSRLEAIVNDLCLSGHVHFLGSVADLELPSLYAMATLFVLTPRELPGNADPEGFGIVYLEAGAFGLPVIGSKTGGVPEAVQHEENGLLVEQGNVQGTENALLRLLGDEILRTQLGNEGKARAHSTALWDQRILPLLERLQTLE